MTSSETAQGNWRPEQLHAADAAYAEIVRRLDVSRQSERDAIANALLKMTGNGCLDTTILVQECIASLYPLAEGKETPGIAPGSAGDAAQFVTI